VKEEVRRLFFALWPDADQRQGLATAARAVRENDTGRPVPEENLHVTLAFLGSVTKDRVTRVEAAAATISADTFELHLDRAGCWRRTGILWLGASSTPPALERLVSCLWSALEPCGFWPDHRDFRPHVTIARRCKKARAGAFEPVAWSVRDFALLESFSGHRGASYKVIGRWPLA